MSATPHQQTTTSSVETLVVRHRPQGETLANFWESDALVQVLIGPLGSAKTTDAVTKIMMYMNFQPHDGLMDKNGLFVRRSRWLIVRNTLVDLKGATIKDWRTVFTDEFGPFKFDSPITHKLSWLCRDGRSRVEAEAVFIGLDAIGDVRKLRGYQLTGIWYDEAKEVAKPIIDMGFGRTGRFPKPADVTYKRRMLLTSNAPDNDHWLAELSRRPPKDWDFFIQPGGVVKRNGVWITNPKAENIQNLQPDYYEAQLGGKKEDWIRSNLANEFVHVVDGRPVHPDFSERTHVADGELQPDMYEPLHLGFDWGRTPACVVAQRFFLPGFDTPQWRFLREITTTNTSIPTFARLVNKLLADEFEGFEFGAMWGDPATNPGNTDDTQFDLMAAAGLTVYPSPCNNDPEIRTAAMDNVLINSIGGEPGVLIDPRCRMLIKGLAGGYNYRRVQVADREVYSDKPDKRDPTSHVVEAAHYVLVGEGEGGRVLGDESFARIAEEVERDYGGWYPDPGSFE